MGTLSSVFSIYCSHYRQKTFFIENCCFCKRIEPKIICNPHLIFRPAAHLVTLTLYTALSLYHLKEMCHPDLIFWPALLFGIWEYCHRWRSCILGRELGPSGVIGIDTDIEVIVVSLTTWEAHHSPRAKPEGCGELPRSLMRQQWPKLRYQFLFYHDETKLMMNKQILSI